MIVTKKLEAEIKQFLDNFWTTYFDGDLETWSNYITDDYKNIGGTEEEIWNSKKEIIDYTIAMMDQMVGSAEIRNKQTQIFSLTPYILAHEFMDMYIKVENEWTFYGKFRLSSILQKNKERWLVVHQHGSYPDSKTEQGEAFAFDKISTENRELKEAVKRRTAELENKTRELTIEASLERVRTVAMSMHKPGDLLKISQVLFNELIVLGFKDVRNALIHIFNDEEGFYYDYDFSEFTGGKITHLPYKGNPAMEDFLTQIRKSDDAFVEVIFDGKDLEDWKKFRKKSGQLNDERIDVATQLNYYFYSFGAGNIGFSSFGAVDNAKLEILKRFRNVFDFSYRRYLDIEKAEAQAREAQIETAVERVRAQSMAMYKTSDLYKVNEELLRQLNLLKVDGLTGVSIYLVDEYDVVKVWDLSSPGNISNPSSYSLKYDAKKYPVMGGWVDKWKSSNEDYFVLDFPKEELLKAVGEFKDILPEMGVQVKNAIDSGKLQHQWNPSGRLSNGILSVDLITPPTDDTKSIVTKMAGAFNMAYQRFLDLQKAEAQAKEAQIESALERVRSRTMAMQKSEELKDVIKVVFDQFVQLNILVEHAGFLMDYKQRDDMHIWLADPHEVPSEVTFPYFDSPHWNSFIDAKEKGLDFFANHLSFEEKNTFYKGLFKLFPVGDEAKDYYFKSPGLAISTVLLDNVGLYIENFSGIPYRHEENETLMRFGKVFQQTYTRFLDLQKAEAQAREAQIELGLERVRARAMAMQKSDELSELVDTVFKELTKLDFAISMCIINIIDESTLSNMVWAANPDTGKPPDCYHMKFEDYPFHHAMMKGYKERNTKCIYVIEGEEKKIYDAYLFNETEFSKMPKEAQAASKALEKYVSSFTFSNFGGLQTVGDAPLSEANLDILSRFGKVFDLTYTRFNDLKQAEAQVREAQIEASLEKVRAHTMGMHASKDLSSVASVMFNQMRNLGGELFSFAIVLCDKQKNTVEQWHNIGNEGMLPPFFVPVDLDYIHQYRYAQWKAGVELFSIEIPKEYIARHFELMFELPSVRDAMAEATAQGVQVKVPEWEIDYGASFRHGYLLVSSFKPFKDDHIFPRFAKVFDQAYTRFLDLQKAEAQAREAQIEAALERVRSRTMAMQKSSELADTSFLLFQQFQALGETSKQISIGIFKEAENIMELYSTLYGSQWKDPVNLDLDEPVVVRKIFVAWKEQKKSMVIDLSGEDLLKYNAYRKKLSNIDYTEDRWVIHIVFFSQGVLTFSVTEPHPDDTVQLLERFAQVFDLTYTRFNDLKNAEAQARESQIQLALERVRARTMAMQKSAELPEAANLLFQQVQSLGMPAWSAGYCIWDEDKRGVTLWMSSEGILQPPFYAPTTEDELFIEMRKGQEAGHSLHVLEMGGDRLARHYQYMRTLPVVSEILDSIIAAGHPLPIFQIMHHAYFSKGFLLFITYEPVPDAHDIFNRFGKVFDQTYTRFLDLQKAEAQARESQIEAALERVRSRTMGMQQSHELGEVAIVLFRELNSLVENLWSCGFVLCDKEQEQDEWWLSTGDGFIPAFYLPHSGDATHAAIYNGWLQGETYHTEQLEGQALQEHYNWLMNIPVSKKIFDDMLAAGNTLPSWQKLHCAYFSYGYLVMITQVPCFEEQIFKRFALVFDQTYTRFLDLQKAEAQAREARIETSLERLRSKTMAMHNSKDVGETVAVMFDELVKLGIDKNIRCGIAIIDESKHMEVWRASVNAAGETGITIGVLDMTIHPLLMQLHEVWTKKEVSHTYELKGKNLTSYYKALNDSPGYPARFDITSLPAKEINSAFIFQEGALFTFSQEPLSALTAQILKRFSGVFAQTYRRYLDLQKAEAQARESQIETALERVRSRTLAMQKSDELAETAAVLFKQLINLGIAPNRLYIGIIKDDMGHIEFWVTDEEGNKVATQFIADVNGNASIKKMYDAWKDENRSLTIDMHGKELKAYFHYLAEKLKVPFKQGLSQKRRIQTVAFFSRGFIGIASPDEQPVETTFLLERFASVFNLTYTRFNDLKVAEAHAIQAEEDLLKLQAEKKRAEDALDELQATQKQLIQSEKMASLGELTAGIAHEIQNPLNFVNNFSEVNRELLAEMKDEIDNKNFEAAKHIAEDILQNEEKIISHGKRADAIVKGMLQHSRSSSGIKEATDINALTDEYLRLAYHGSRAKDKSFNVSLKTDFDETAGEVNIIPQDIGRVILNLVTNAFYAVTERKKEHPQDYEPSVKVATKKIYNKVCITVTDNGNGIPQNIYNKIFQPFFTTKPTGQGTGLGLSLSYDIVKAHGGELRVETLSVEAADQASKGEKGMPAEVVTEAGSKFIIQLPA